MKKHCIISIYQYFTERGYDMQKIFYITKCSEKSEASPPEFDRFKRVEHLNELLDLGWRIKELKTENCDTYFILEKDDKK